MYAAQINNVHDLQEKIRNGFKTIQTMSDIFQRAIQY